MAEVGCGSWLGLVFGLWLKWVVGCWRSPVFGSNEVMVRLAWVTMMGLVEIGVGHHMVGWFFWVSDGFIYLFFNMGFCFSGILVSSEQWWLGFFWVFVRMGFSRLIIGVFWVFLTAGFFWVDHWLQLVWWIVCVWLCLRFDGLCFCVCDDGFG